jgi:general stress protein YciG
MTDENKVAKYGSIAAYNQHMRDIARKPRPNSKGGSFKNNSKLASEMAKKSWQVRRASNEQTR